MYQQWEVTIPAITGDEPRNAYVYVPDAAFADDGRRYPVLYMFDGQNLFRNADATYGKSWGLLDYLSAHDVPLILAAVECNHHDEADECGGRLSEYSPFDFSEEGWGSIVGRGRLTMEYFINEFKPFIDASFPTLPDRAHTFIGGSSMGGLMTIYALTEFNAVFSRGAALSPSLEFSPKRVEKLIKESPMKKTVLYMDMGAKELRRPRARQIFGDTAALLVRRGVLLTARIVPNGEHNERSWEKQIPFFLPTLLY